MSRGPWALVFGQGLLGRWPGRGPCWRLGRRRRRGCGRLVRLFELRDLLESRRLFGFRGRGRRLHGLLELACQVLTRRLFEFRDFLECGRLFLVALRQRLLCRGGRRRRWGSGLGLRRRGGGGGGPGRGPARRGGPRGAWGGGG